MVHSGGFYTVEKQKSLGVAPEQVRWFRWEAFVTWLAGVILLVLVYYLGDGLIDVDVADISKQAGIAIGVGAMVTGWIIYDLAVRSPLGKSQAAFAGFGLVMTAAVAWGLMHVFSGRAAYIHVGAIFGTIMTLNVWMRILPAQRGMIAAAAGGEKFDASLGGQAKLRAKHNTFMAVPRGFYPGVSPGVPRILVGSHLDTVPNAGAFDGILGVVLVVGLVKSLEGMKLPFGIEVVGFSEEEGVRFGVPFIGSRALVGRVDEELLGRKDERGISVRKAIQDFGLNPNEISKAVLSDDVLGYLEFHIEQGPVLENLGRPLGVVEAIVGQNRMEFTFSGQANHAGTTPMNLRHDALSAGAEWILAAENLAQRTPGMVATGGFVEAKPGATNVIPGEARATLDIRHASDRERTEALDKLIRQAESNAVRRGVTVKWRTLLAQHAVAMDPFLTEQIERAIQTAGCEPHRMASDAGP